MTAARQVLDVARTHLGTVEGKDSSNPYGRAYGVDRVAWCAQFLWFVFREAGASSLIHPKTAYTPTLADWFRKRDQFSGTPQVGDLVFYNWPDSVNRIQHVGLVEAVESAAIVALEGNTSTGNDSDGGRVMRRRRARNASIVGYGHPAYTPTTAEDWFAVATKEELAAVVNAALDAKLGRTVWESTGVLPNRRGPAGEQVGKYADTAFGMAITAEGATYRIEQLLQRLMGGTGGPAQMTAADRHAIAVEVADLLATRLSS